MKLAATLGVLLAVCGWAHAQESIRVLRDVRGRWVVTNTRGGSYAGAANAPAAVSLPSVVARRRNGSNRWNPLIREVARRHGVSPALVRAVVAVESGFDPRAVSPKGARGLMQLMPATAAEWNVDDVYDPEQNLDAGTRHLRALLEVFEGDVTLALAAYNAGAGAVRRHGGVPPYPETREYVRRVLQQLSDGPDLLPGRRGLTPYRDGRGRLVLSNVPQPGVARSSHE